MLPYVLLVPLDIHVKAGRFASVCARPKCVAAWSTFTDMIATHEYPYLDVQTVIDPLEERSERTVREANLNSNKNENPTIQG